MGLAELSVLIVDDHQGMRELLRKVLERAGVSRVREAANGPEALAALEAESAHLILADRNMPGMSGEQLTVRVRQDARWREVRIILVTGDSRAEPGEADALLVKPVSPRDMLAAIEKTMR